MKPEIPKEEIMKTTIILLGFLFLNHISVFLYNHHIQIDASSENATALKIRFPYFPFKFSFVSIPFQLALSSIFLFCKM